MESKACGLQSLSRLVSKNADKVISTKLVRLAAPLMRCQRSDDVRHAATGALRNLSLVSAEVCDEMVSQDIMTPLVSLVKTYAEWNPEPKATTDDVMEVDGGKKKKGKANKKKSSENGEETPDAMAEVFIEAVNLLWNLCEANTTALQIFNKEGLAE